MTTEINYAEITHRILGKLKDIDVEKGESLQPFMEQFEHIKLRDGFVIDAYYTGGFYGGCYQLYARNRGISDPFIESKALKDKNFFRRLSKSLEDKFGGEMDDDWGNGTHQNNTELSMSCDSYIEGQPIQGVVSPRTSRELIPSLFDYIECKLNKHSAWELFVLSESFSFMPLFWHAGYASRTYIFERADLDKLVSKPILHWNGRERIDITADVATYLYDESLLPRVSILSENEALVRYSYWNDWSGLMNAEIKITKESGTTTFSDVYRRTLVEYHCGIIY